MPSSSPWGQGYAALTLSPPLGKLFASLGTPIPQPQRCPAPCTAREGVRAGPGEGHGLRGQQTGMDGRCRAGPAWGGDSRVDRGICPPRKGVSPEGSPPSPASPRRCPLTWWQQHGAIGGTGRRLRGWRCRRAARSRGALPSPAAPGLAIPESCTVRNWRYRRAAQSGIGGAGSAAQPGGAGMGDANGPGPPRRSAPLRLRRHRAAGPGGGGGGGGGVGGKSPAAPTAPPLLPGSGQRRGAAGGSSRRCGGGGRRVCAIEPICDEFPPPHSGWVFPLPHGCHTTPELPSLSPCPSPSPTLTPSLSPSPPSISFNPFHVPIHVFIEPCPCLCPHPSPHFTLAWAFLPPTPRSLTFSQFHPWQRLLFPQEQNKSLKTNKQKNAKTDKKHFYFLSMTRLPACLGVTLFQACLLFMFRYIYIN